MKPLDPATLPLSRSQLIEASAGTGKTYTITNLCLRLLLGRDLPGGRPLAINQILILTFTIAATAELKARVAKRIHQARHAFRTGEGDDDLLALVNSADDPQRDLKLLTAASQLMDEASIFTIHGFCARVLGEQAFETGSLFDTTLNAESDHLLQTACEDCFRSLVLPLPPAGRALANSLWNNPDDMARQFSRFLFRGPLTAYPPEDESVTLDGLVSLVTEIKTRWLQDDLDALLRASKLHKRRKPFLRLDQMKAFCEAPVFEPDTELWEIYSSESIEGAMTGGATAPEHPVFAMIDTLPAMIKQLKANLWHQARDFITHAMQTLKVDGNLLTLDDLLTRLADAVNQLDGTLARSLAARWPVAMIDEFQDTDPIQSSIFTPVYGSGNDEHCLLMIGDPKQAIYGFRGADIYTYINARRSLAETYSLATNWRSSPAMIEATNRLFDQPDIFGTSDIPFVPVSPPPDHADMAMTLDGQPALPYQVFVVDHPDKFTSNAEAIERLMAHAAEQTVQLLNNPDKAHVDGEPVNAGQIAFLVRRRADATAAQRALAMRGVKSVYLTLESVFLQPIAEDLKLVLAAIIEPTRDQAVRSALATRLMQSTASEIDQLNNDIQLQQQVTEEFQAYHQLWLDKDIAHMLASLMKARELDRKWLAQPDGERQLTNLRHLIEILQQQSIITPGMHQLVKWFSHEQREAETVSSEERQLRLESDENLVKIVTMHAAKGLEYDIVMIPMPVFLSPGDRAPYLYHEENSDGFEAAIALFDSPAQKNWHTEETWAEEMRLLYVSLTRARYRCYLGLPKIDKLPASGIARLIGADDFNKEQSLLETARTTLPNTLFDVIPAADDDCTLLAPATDTSDALVPPPAKPAVDDRWRIHSYTSVAARLHSPGAVQVTGFADDDDQSSGTATGPLRTRYSFPRGARTGIALHSLMEDIDFQATDHSSLCERTLRRLALETDWLPVLRQWLDDMLHAPLSVPMAADGSADLAPFCLADIARADRLDEMEFHFTLSSSRDLTRILASQGIVPEATPALELQGQMTGLIDLLFRRDGLYFIVDYKSNDLGSRPGSYESDSLAHAMDQHQYHLQYLIYTVAVHRMLRHRLKDYDYEQHFGGVYYLFMRGLNPQDQRGIYFNRPTLDQIEQLDQLLESGNGS